jgi:hypothetical protein
VTKAEIVRLLTRASTVDQREPDEAMVEGWHWLLDDVAYADAEAALREHYTHSTEFARPAHLIAIIEGWREQWANTNRPGSRPPGWPATQRLVAPEDMTPEELDRALGKVTPLPPPPGPRPLAGGAEL